MKQMTGFMNEIADEFKIIIVEAVRSLCLKFPSKQYQMMSFLSSSLRDEGGYELKGTIVDAIFDIVHKIPESKEVGNLKLLNLKLLLIFASLLKIANIRSFQFVFYIYWVATDLPYLQIPQDIYGLYTIG